MPPRHDLLWFVLLFVAQCARECRNELLTSKPVGHHPLERTTNPLLILSRSNQPSAKFSLMYRSLS
jgi:hypothetical protein